VSEKLNSRECQNCKGTGNVFDGWEDTSPCPDCGGSGSTPSAPQAAKPENDIPWQDTETDVTLPHAFFGSRECWLRNGERQCGRDYSDSIHKTSPVRTERDELAEAAKHVCWFDWSDNDDDAVEAIEELRRALAAQPAPDQKGKL
jgi:hypothetical protein